MAFGIKDIDLKIAAAQADLDYWKQVRAFIVDPRFIALEDETEDSYLKPQQAISAAAHSNGAAPSVRPKYGLLKKQVLENLPLPTAEAVTPQELADILAKGGYSFVTKTPAISVNDTLQGLAESGKAKIVGKRGTANLWVGTGEQN